MFFFSKALVDSSVVDSHTSFSISACNVELEWSEIREGTWMSRDEYDFLESLDEL